MRSKGITLLLTFGLLAGCATPTATSTGVPLTHVATTTPTAAFTREPISNKPTPAPTPDVAVGASFIGTFQGGELAILHVSTGFTEFYPETIEIIDSSTKQVLAGPFSLNKNGSGLCGGSWTYDSEGLKAFELPDNFQVRVSSPPYYIFRVTGHRPSGEEATREFLTGAQFTCEKSTNPIEVAMSLIEYESSQKESEYYLHVNVLDRNGGFVPIAIEIIDPDTNQVVAGPFQLAEKDSELCNRRGYETENIRSLLTGNWSLRPGYIYRVRLTNAASEEITLEAREELDICKQVLR